VVRALKDKGFFRSGRTEVASAADRHGPHCSGAGRGAPGCAGVPRGAPPCFGARLRACARPLAFPRRLQRSSTRSLRLPARWLTRGWDAWLGTVELSFSTSNLGHFARAYPGPVVHRAAACRIQPQHAASSRSMLHKRGAAHGASAPHLKETLAEPPESALPFIGGGRPGRTTPVRTVSAQRLVVVGQRQRDRCRRWQLWGSARATRSVRKVQDLSRREYPRNPRHRSRR
jgi:hypothetical protein